MALLQKDETVSAWTEVQASPDQIYAVVSDVTRIPAWSPETVRVEWLGSDRFRAWNRRRLGRWRTTARVAEAEPGRRFLRRAGHGRRLDAVDLPDRTR